MLGQEIGELAWFACEGYLILVQKLLGPLLHELLEWFAWRDCFHEHHICSAMFSDHLSPNWLAKYLPFHRESEKVGEKKKIQYPVANALKVNLFVFSFLGEVTGFMSRIPMRNLRKTMMASKVWQEKTWIPWVHPNHLDIPVLSLVKSRLLPPRPGSEPRVVQLEN